MPCPGVDPQDGWLYVSKTDNGDEFTRLAGLIGEFGAEIEGWPTEQVRAVLRSERYFHAIHYPRAIQYPPAELCARPGRRRRTRRRPHLRANAGIVHRPCGRAQTHRHAEARVRANHIVLCGNVQIAGLMPQVAAALIPITTYVITTAPLGPRLAEAIGYRGAVSDSELADNHYRIVDGDRLMWSGRSTTWARDPRRYVRALTADIKKTYPQLGERCRRLCVVRHPGQLRSTACRRSASSVPDCGWRAALAVTVSTPRRMAGNLIARAIVEGDQTWRQFTPFELVWAGGIFGRAITQAYYWTKRLRDGLAERRARAADTAHHRAHHPSW